MDLDGLWSLVREARTAPGGPSEHATELERLLRAKSPSEIEDFARIQGELMRDSYRWDLWGAAYVINQGCSDDGFDYFRGWLLVQGRDVWDAALRDPETLAEIPMGGDVQCEDALYVASKAYEESTGTTLPPQHPQPSEPTGVPWNESDLEALFPRLWKRFGASTNKEEGFRDEWDVQMALGFSLLASGRYMISAERFALVREGAPRPLTRTLALNNIAWADLMINTPEANNAALPLARQARKEIEAESYAAPYMDAVGGTLAFALIKNGEPEEGLAVIDDVLPRTSPKSNLYATRLCIKAIGLATSGDTGNARALVSEARKRDASCQLLGQARLAAFGPPIPVPAALKALAPLVDDFGISDDSEREKAIETAPTEELARLVRTVTAEIFAEINRYLDETDNAEDAIRFGDLAQAAEEAKLELKLRGVTEV
jgi:hypothetical protein